MTRLASAFVILILMLMAGAAQTTAADPRDILFDTLRNAPTEAIGSAAEDEVWRYWMVGPTDEATKLVASAMERRRWYDFAGALEILDKAVAVAPDWSEVWNQRAFIHFLRDEFDLSLADLERALELEPKHFGALAGKARILMRQGRMALGQKILRQAVDIHPFLKERSMLIAVPETDL